MHLYELQDRPKNLQSYLRPPDEAKSDAQIEAWLRKMFQQAEVSLHIPECFLKTVKEVHQVAAQGGYQISFMQIAGKTASAEFFFARAVAE